MSRAEETRGRNSQEGRSKVTPRKDWNVVKVLRKVMVVLRWTVLGIDTHLGRTEAGGVAELPLNTEMCQHASHCYSYTGTIGSRLLCS